VDSAAVARKAILLGVWGAVFTVSLRAALRGPDILNTDGDVIASLGALAGDVAVRDSGSPLWSDAVGRQGLVGGTVVATGDSARAAIKFLDGQELALGANSQLLIEIPQRGGSSAVITLVKGTVDSHMGAAAPTSFGALAPLLNPRKVSLTIKAGDKEIILRRGEDRAKIERTPGAATATVAVTGGQPQLLPTPRTVEAPAAPDTPPSIPATPTPTATPTATPPATTAAAPKNLSIPPQSIPPQLMTPARHLIYWTPRSFSKGAHAAIPLGLTAAPHSKDRPAVEVRIENKAVRKILGEPGSQSQHYTAMVDVTGSEPMVLRPTVATGDAGFDPGPEHDVTVQVRSLADTASDAAVSVRLHQLAMANGDAPILEDPNFQGRKTDTVMIVRGGALANLTRYLRGSGGFVIDINPHPAPESGFHVMGGGHWRGTLTQADVSKNEIRGLMRSLGGQIMFRGAVASYRHELPQDVSAPMTIITRKGYRVALHPDILKTATGLQLAKSEGRHFFTHEPAAIIPEPRDPTAEVAPPASWQDTNRKGRSRWRFAFISKTPANAAPEMLPVDAAAFNSLGMIAVVNRAEFSLAYNINRYHKDQAPHAKGAAADRIGHLLAVSGADAIVLSPPDGPWLLITRIGGSTKKLGQAAPPAATDVASLHAWLIRILGYDGVVLEREGPLALAACVRSKAAPARQGIANNPPAAFEVVSEQSGLCTVRTLLGEDLPVGAHLKFE